MQQVKASQQQKKKYITLIEIMIVMFLIALIAGVVAYNYRGSLDEGRAFETKQNMQKVKNILELYYLKQPGGIPTELDAAKAQDALKKSGLVPDAAKLVQDGWGKAFTIKVENGEIMVTTDSPYCQTDEGKKKCGLE